MPATAPCAYAAFTSRAPIVRWAGHSQGMDPIADEVGAFFARLMVPVDYQPEAEARVAEAGPEALYAVFLRHSAGPAPPVAAACATRTRGSPAGWRTRGTGWSTTRRPTGAREQELLGWLELG